ncbi:cytochrome P450 CYP736A12-like [Neltuma alba]|uniref:cytochrome P450 CYP736A12-like n=1 Tax=Neltuma alba TaxID=207710 RepID=UPI0010A370D8|nr:cytochrome P450 CYP736A12-like [Prosopis alba]
MLSLIRQPTDLYDDQNSVIDRDHLKAILAYMIFAATDASVIVVDCALSELLRHPRVIKNLQTELQNVVGMNRMVDEADLAELSYSDMVIKETLRLHPPAPLLIPRESMKDVTVNGYCIRKKSRIMMNAWAIGRDPKLWSDDAYMFYPERFIDNNIDIHGHNYQFLPFGSGRRRCPGLQMGMTTVKLVVAQLVQCFSWELPCGVCPSDLDMNEKFGLTVRRTKHLQVVPTCRLHTDYSN